MNADGRHGIDVGADLGAKLPALPWIGLGVLIAGAVFLAGGGLLIAGDPRPPRQPSAGPTWWKERHAADQEAASSRPQARRGHEWREHRRAHGATCTGELRERGYDVFAVNPNADEVEGIVPTRI